MSKRSRLLKYERKDGVRVKEVERETRESVFLSRIEKKCVCGWGGVGGGGASASESFSADLDFLTLHFFSRTTAVRNAARFLSLSP